MRESLFRQKASVLIMVLWALTLLSVFAVQIGLMTRDKIAFLARADRQSILRNAARGGIAKALAIIENDRMKNIGNPLQTKVSLYYNPAAFRDLDFGRAVAAVMHSAHDDHLYGVTDERSRLNLNYAQRDQIRKLLIATEAVKEDHADKISSAIYDWHNYGESEIEGFSNDGDYDSLQYPYPPKKAEFETLDELRLVQGITEDVYNRLIDYVTVYGVEKININTVSWPVLVALGLSDEQAKMVETLRRGADGLDGTPDDSIFQNIPQFLDALIQALGLDKDEANSLGVAVSQIPMTFHSDIFRVYSVAKLVSRNENKSITCVFDINGDKIIYWHER